MTICKDKVVTIHYTLTNDGGTVIDDSRDAEPLQYIQGTNYLLSRLEQLMEGHRAGDTFHADLTAGQAYGDYDKSLVVSVPCDSFDADTPLEPGMKFLAQTDRGTQVVTIADVGPDTITVDANHELAGQNLHFDIEIIDVRDATPEELEGGLGGCSCGGCGGDCSCDGGCEGGCMGSCH